jgi:hypothetical protein
MDWVVRFLLGGTIVAVFALTGDLLKPKGFAGLFGAAPAVALATLGLPSRPKGKSMPPSRPLDGRGRGSLLSLRTWVPLCHRREALRGSDCDSRVLVDLGGDRFWPLGGILTANV